MPQSERTIFDERALAGAFLFLIVLISKAGTINLPFYWDEAGAYISPAHWLANGSLLRSLPGFHPPYMFFGHPFALYLTLASIYKVTGETVNVSHIFILAITFLGLYYTYLLGKNLYNGQVGLISSLLLFFSPLYFAQCGMVNGDVVITSLGVMTMYYLVKKNYIPYLITGILLVLTKESAIAFIVAALIYLMVEAKSGADLAGNLARYSIPLIVIVVFFALQKIFTGMILPNGYFSSHNFFELSFGALSHKLTDVLSWTFITQGRWTLSAVLLLGFTVYRKIMIRKEYVLFGSLFFFFIGTYSCIYFLPRYILPILPYFFIMSAAAIFSLFSYKKIFVVMVLSIMAISINRTYGYSTGYGNYEEDMQYADVVLTHKAACAFVEANFPDEKILASWPLVADLQYPFLGYVKHPLKATSNPNEGYDVLVYTRQSDMYSAKALENIILNSIVNKGPLVLEKKFVRNGKSVEIYTKRARASGR
jgi:Dolichyl-phosphate-mannose-protein mannosyltransferase